VERDGPRVHNAVLVFAPDGTCVAHYRKRHPWYPETWAAPGSSAAPVFQLGRVRVTLAICFDVQFLEEAAETLGRADVLLFPSAWVERDDSRGRLLPAVARRFDVAVVNANWGVGSPRVPGQGGSLVVEHDGSVVARLPPAPGTATRLDAQVRQDL
jgi:predicted amidohydrolase